MTRNVSTILDIHRATGTWRGAGYNNVSNQDRPNKSSLLELEVMWNKWRNKEQKGA